MILKLSLDFEEIVSYASVSTNEDLLLSINNLTETENCNFIAPDEIDMIIVRIQPSLNNIDLEAWLGSTLLDHASGDVDTFPSELERILEDGEEPLVVYGNVVETSVFIKLIKNDAVNMNIEGLTGIVLYKQNSANNVLNKSLTLSNIIQGKFNIPIALKSFTLDLDGNYVFNYIWIPLLNRYYYVNSIQRYTDKLTRYTFGEDVLMSWQDLIKSQSALITRQENYNYKDSIIDNRLPVTDTIYYHVFNPNMLDEKNITFDFEPVIPASGGGYEKNNFNILVSTYTKELYTSLNLDNIESPDLVLPSISPLRTRSNFKSLISLDGYSGLVAACVKNDTVASFVQSVLWLPFNAVDLFNTQLSNKGVFANDKVLCGINGGEWLTNGSENNPVEGYWVFDGVCPYLVIADFMFNDTGIGDTNLGIASYSPISKWEIYVPFVGWQEVDFNAVKGKRIFVFYAMDLDTGLSTAYIYNKTDSIILWSGTCQIGIRLNLVTTNELENTRQKQANDLNMILGTIGAGLSIAVGAASGNGFAIAAGALTATKTIASAVNSNNMLFERASMSFGTSNTALYSKTEVQVRRSYHNLIPIDDSVYGRINGYPSNTYESLSNLTGYTEIGDIQFNPMNYNITQDEINEIVAILRNGVIM
ncbi:MAG: hypothetical protein IKA12_04210 [Clostridia bacterium]|nr:hypothetical protein [Clostridia bacterium]